MSEFIRETILTTLGPDGQTHIAPMGVRERDGLLLIAPFRPSGTLDNLLRERHAVVNQTDDVRVYAGCLTGHFDWPLAPATQVIGHRLRDCLAHQELKVVRIDRDDQRPKLYCEIVHEANHRPFRGFNRAQAAVLELAILVSRLGMLPDAKIDAELHYLRIAMDKTAGEREWEAWGWLEERLLRHRRSACA
ncbi:MAG: DUF447 domain-containing protein [Thiohalocapsa sp.]